MNKQQKKLVLDKNTVKKIQVKTQIKTGGNSYSKYCVTTVGGTGPSSGIADSE